MKWNKFVITTLVVSIFWGYIIYVLMSTDNQASWNGGTIFWLALVGVVYFALWVEKGKIHLNPTFTKASFYGLMLLT